MEPIILSSIQGLYVVIGTIALLPIFGALFAYVTFEKLKSDAAILSLFSSFLMIILGSYLFLLHVIKTQFTPGFYIVIGKGALTGFLFAVLAVSFSRYFAEHQRRLYIASLVFCMLMVHEIIEGYAIAEVFFEFSNESIPFFASFVTFGVLAIHEFPEGMGLVMPFFLSNEYKKGVFALFLDVIIFAGSALLTYYFFLGRYYEPSISQWAFFTGIPAGGILFLGFHEGWHALKMHAFMRFHETRMATKVVMSMISLTVVSSVGWALVHADKHTKIKQRGEYIPGYERAANGELIPITLPDPCQYRFDPEYCID